MKLVDQYLLVMLAAYCASKLSETTVGAVGFGVIALAYGARSLICGWQDRQ